LTGYRQSTYHNLNQEYAENLTLVRQDFIKKSLLTSFNKRTSSKEEIISIINFFGSKIFRKRNQFETESEYFLATKKHYLSLSRDQIVLELKPENESSSLFSNEPRLFYQLEENRIGSSVEKRKGLHIAMFPSYGSYRFPIHSTGFRQNKVEFSISPIILSEDLYWAFLNGCDGKSYTESLFEKENPWTKCKSVFLDIDRQEAKEIFSHLKARIFLTPAGKTETYSLGEDYSGNSKGRGVSLKAKLDHIVLIDSRDNSTFYAWSNLAAKSPQPKRKLEIKGNLPELKTPILPTGNLRKNKSYNFNAYALVEFDVTKTGKTKNAKVLEVQPRDINIPKIIPAGWLTKPALRFIKRVKFKPRIENGTPVQSKNEQYLVRWPSICNL